MCDLTLFVLRALNAIFAVGLADGLQWPDRGVVTVEALNAVCMCVARFVLLVPHAHLLTVTTLALAGKGACAARIKRLAQVASILAMSNLHFLRDLRGVSVWTKAKREY